MRRHTPSPTAKAGAERLRGHGNAAIALQSPPAPTQVSAPASRARADDGAEQVVPAKTSGNDRSRTGPSDVASARPRRLLRDGSAPPRRREASSRPAPHPPPRRCLQGTSTAGLHRRGGEPGRLRNPELSRKGRQIGRRRPAPCTCGTAQRCAVSPPPRGLARARPLRGSPRGRGGGVLGARPERGEHSDVRALGWIGLRAGHRGRGGEGRDPDHARGERIAEGQRGALCAWRRGQGHTPHTAACSRDRRGLLKSGRSDA